MFQQVGHYPHRQPVYGKKAQVLEYIEHRAFARAGKSCDYKNRQTFTLFHGATPFPTF
jgi:hypothetical protein